MFRPDQPARSQPQPGHVYDVAVVGAGVAGCELAWRLAAGGLDVLLVSQALDHLGNLYQPTLAGVTFAPGSLSAQVQVGLPPGADLWRYHRALKERLERASGIHLLQSCVTGLDEDPAGVTLRTWEGPPLRARQAVLAVGAFLKARLMIGETMEEAGRLSEVAYDFLADDLGRQGLWLRPQEQEAAAHEDAPAYQVRYLTLGASDLDGFRVRRLDHVWALGQVMGGQPDYAQVLADAARLADQLLPGALLEGPA
jgi:tRNA U34 5-carboxymethylaminomethyl modifying enzyme MnmG/GidA